MRFRTLLTLLCLCGLLCGVGFIVLNIYWMPASHWQSKAVLAHGRVQPDSDAASRLSAQIKADGSSSVFLISVQLARQFHKLHPQVDIEIKPSGTGGGFKKFAAGETDISLADRPMRPDEAALCQKHGIDFVVLQVAWEAIAVVINKENTWAEKLTVEQLKKIWHPDIEDFQNAKLWSEVDRNWPKEMVEPYAPGPDSGTFDFFSQKINGKGRAWRRDVNLAMDDHIIISGVNGNKYALGFCNWSFAVKFKDRVKIAAIAAKTGDNYVAPSQETIRDGSYQPLSRPLYIYVKRSSLQRPEVAEFVSFHLARVDLVEQAEFVPLTTAQQQSQQVKLGQSMSQK